MEIVYHLGAQATDEDRLIRCLLKSQRPLLEQGIVAASPPKFRSLIRDIINGLNGRRAPDEMQELLIDAVTNLDEPKRVIFSHFNFFCGANRVLGEGRIFPMAGEKTAALRNLFPDDTAIFCMGIRNIATFAPALFAQVGESDFGNFLSAVNVTELRWSETIARMHDAAPDSRIIIWCNEDTPILWPEILAAIGGFAPDTPLVGSDDFIATLMSSEGLSRMQGYLAEYPPGNDERRRHVIAAFLEKFGIEGELEEEIDLPGWTQELIDGLTALYEADMEAIAAIPNVTLLR